MAFTVLETNYKNDVLDEDFNTNVVYQMERSDGTPPESVTLTDVTVYSQLGDALDASVINTTNATVNSIGSQVDNNTASIVANAANITDLLAGKINFDTTAGTGTTDGNLKNALTALGWLSAVVE